MQKIFDASKRNEEISEEYLNIVDGFWFKMTKKEKDYINKCFIKGSKFGFVTD